MEITDRRAGDVAVSYADVSKAKELLGWEASADLQHECAVTAGALRCKIQTAYNRLCRESAETGSHRKEYI
ncbi:hypothetical protein [Ruminococcus sp.]|uniref:hypothetical protein n=1 Tax=Ruminococcus sp. TaxID=41978 RepID=UPI00399502B9